MPVSMIAVGPSREQTIMRRWESAPVGQHAFDSYAVTSRRGASSGYTIYWRFNELTSFMQGEFVSKQLRIAAEPRRNPGHALTGRAFVGGHRPRHSGCFFFPRVWMVIATIFLVYFIVRMCVTTVFALIGQRKIHAVASSATGPWARTRSGPFGFAPSDVRHVVIVPTYKEPAEILDRTLDALAAQHRADERLIVGARHGGARARRPRQGRGDDRGVRRAASCT